MKMMFERFTNRARRVIILAQEETRLLDYDYIGTEHLLLGLIHEGEGVACKALESLGTSLDVVREQIQEVVGTGPGTPSGHIPFKGAGRLASEFTPRAKKVLELSLKESLQLGHQYIGTEHILLGLIREGEGVAAQVLQRLGMELPQVRVQVIHLLSGASGKQVAEGSWLSSSEAEQIRHDVAKVYAKDFTLTVGNWADLHRADDGSQVCIRFANIVSLAEGHETVGGEEIPCTWVTLTNGVQTAVQEGIAEIRAQEFVTEVQ